MQPEKDVILSIQSHVAYGYVGNRAAVFPLQRLGFDVAAINTVQFSNHTGYGAWTGDAMTPDHIKAVINGLRDRGVLGRVGALLTGYMGDPDLGAIILALADEIRAANRDFIYVQDPVMGDTGRGFFVRPGIPEFFRDKGIEKATIITPNQFELSWLAGMEIGTRHDARQACEKILDKGPSMVLLTSLQTAETPDDEIQMMLMQKNGHGWMISTPHLPITPNGSGDATAALFLGHYLREKDPARALEKTAGAIFSIFEQTLRHGSRELSLIAAQDAFNPQTTRFSAVRL